MDRETLDRLKTLDVDVSQIKDDALRSDISFLHDSVEQFYHEVEALQQEIQKLKDEINRLKGEQGKPKIRPQKKPKDDHSSEKERNATNKNKKEKKSKKKKHKIQTHESRICELDQSTLPADAIFKGYDSVVIQGIKFHAHNVELKREVYYSPSQGQRFVAPLPNGYQGEFSPELKAFILSLHFGFKMTQPDLVNLLKDIGVHIAASTIARMILDESEQFGSEKQEIVAAGKQATDYQQIDDTSARVKGQNHYMQILCNDFYTAYFTCPNKDRLTVLEVLNGEPLMFSLSKEAIGLMKAMALPHKYWAQVETFSDKHQQGTVNREELNQLLQRLFPNTNKHHKNRQIILEASAITAYQHREDAIKILLCDDAPQFKNLTALLGLCWIHEGRHLKKLNPFRTANRRKLDTFLAEFWAFYHSLLDYKEGPNSARAVALEEQFKAIFTQTTDYRDLDERIAKIFAKKESLLLVLKHPHLPLHNNTSELGARRQARYRDVSLQNQNKRGTDAKDTMLTITQTARKLGVSAYQYIKDRVTKTYDMPSLASLIEQASLTFLRPKPG